MSCKQSLRFGLGYSEEAPMFAGIRHVDLLGRVRPVHPVARFNRFISGAGWAIVIVKDDVLLSYLHHTWSF